MKKNRYYVDRLRSIQSRMPQRNAPDPRFATAASLVREFNGVLSQAETKAPRISDRLAGIEPFEAKEENGYCHGVREPDFNGRLAEALARLGASQITDDEVRRFITDKFVDSHWFVTKRTAVGSFLGVIVAMLALNVGSVWAVLSSSQLAESTKRARQWEKEARAAATAIQQLRDQLSSE